MSPLQLFYIFIVLPTFAPIQAIQYQLINNATGTPGGTRFEYEIGIPCSKQTLEFATNFIWQTFKQSDEGDRKNYEEVTMVVESFVGAAAYVLSNTINVNSDYIANYQGDVKNEVIGLLYHETTHVWQWFSNNEAPSGLIEGIADYVRLKAALAPLNWVKRGSGARRDEGYAVTAYFLEYCNWLKEGFVAELNALMKDSYSDDFFMQLLGKSVDELWNDYKSLYGN